MLLDLGGIKGGRIPATGKQKKIFFIRLEAGGICKQVTLFFIYNIIFSFLYNHTYTCTTFGKFL